MYQKTQCYLKHCSLSLSTEDHCRLDLARGYSQGQMMMVPILEPAKNNNSFNIQLIASKKNQIHKIKMQMFCTSVYDVANNDHPIHFCWYAIILFLIRVLRVQELRTASLGKIRS